MSYQVLARKWRPQTFSELVGQQHVVDAITNALNNDKLHHAYLFTGTRGVGKTTIARIFSKSLNCEEGQSANPCGKCGTCLDISEGRFVDLLEIDAASRTKVEDTRELLDNVQYKPTRGKFKVYLIDEVHMLSKHSFNALLKTLEEPPPHVKFLLATTDPQKLPVTILSRCLQFSLKSLSREQIHAQLVHILSAENLEFEAPALSQIARAAAGSMRDALSLTDQAIAQGNNRVTLDTVISMLGLLDKNQVLRLAKCICERDAENAMQQLDEICADSPDYSQVLSQLLALFHQVALTQIVPDICKLDTNAAKPVYTLSKAVSAEHIQLLYQIGLNGKRDLPFAPDALTGLQMTVMRMIAFTPAQSIPLEISAPVAANNSDLVSQGAAGSHTSTTGESANEQLSSSSLDSPKIHNMSVNSPEVSSSSTPNDADGKSIDLDEVSIESNAHIDTEVSSRSFAVDERYETHEYLLDSSQNEGYHVDDHPRNLNVEQQSPVEHNAGTFDQEPAKSSNTDAQPETEEDSVAHLQGLFDMEQDLASYEQQALGDTDAKKPEAHYREAAPAALQEAPAPAPILANQAPVHTPRSANTEAHNDLSNRESAAPAPQKTSEPVPALPAQGRPEIAAYLENGDKLVLAAQIDRWSQFVDSLGVRGLARQLLVHSRSTGIKDNCLLLEIDKSHHHLNENSSIQTIKEALSLKCERSIEVNVDYALVGNTPYELQQQIDAMRLDHAKETVGNDNAFQELIKAFDAQVIEDSIEAR